MESGINNNKRETNQRSGPSYFQINNLEDFGLSDDETYSDEEIVILPPKG